MLKTTRLSELKDRNIVQQGKVTQKGQDAHEQNGNGATQNHAFITRSNCQTTWLTDRHLLCVSCSSELVSSSCDCSRPRCTSRSINCCCCCCCSSSCSSNSCCLRSNSAFCRRSVFMRGDVAWLYGEPVWAHACRISVLLFCCQEIITYLCTYIKFALK